MNLIIDSQCTGTPSPCDVPNFFLGATRTFSYFAEWFDSGWHQGLPTLDQYCNYPSSVETCETPCLDGTYARANMFLFGTQFGMQSDEGGARSDYIKWQYFHELMTANINEATRYIVKWQDDGILFAVLSPISLAFYFNCGTWCYNCSYADYRCRGNPPGWSQLWNLHQRMDDYWINTNPNGPPYPTPNPTIYPLDYWGVLRRGPEPFIGWKRYVLGKPGGAGALGFGAGVPDCNYCGCIVFCMYIQCIDPWFLFKYYVAKMFLFNKNSGLPFLMPNFLLEFEDKNSYEFGENLDIKLDHLADELVFVKGLADMRVGKIRMKDTDVFGNYVNGVKKFDYNPKNPSYKEASFATGTGNSFTYVGAKMIPGADDFVTGYVISETAVRYKNQSTKSNIEFYGWLKVDIPEYISELEKRVTFSYDWYEIASAPGSFSPPGVLYGLGNPPENTSEEFYLWASNKELYCKSYDSQIQKEGQWLSYPSVVALGKPNGDDNLLTKITYYKRYSKKLVKAPHIQYIKSGEDFFRNCKLGETLRDLTPGIYFFPNPVYCQSTYNLYNPNTNYQWADVEDPDVFDFVRTFQTRLRVFKDYRDARTNLGLPWGQNMSLEGKLNYREIEDSFQYSYKAPTYKRDFLGIIFKSIFDARQQLRAADLKLKEVQSLAGSSNSATELTPIPAPPSAKPQVFFNENFNTDFKDGVKPGTTIILPPPKPIPGLVPPTPGQS